MVTQRAKGTNGLNTRVPEPVYLGIKMAQKQQRERVNSWRDELGLPPVKNRKLQIKFTRNMRAAQHQYARKEWYKKYGVYPHSHAHESVHDKVSIRLTRRDVFGEDPTGTQTSRLDDETLSLAPAWWNASPTAQATLTDRETGKLPKGLQAVDLVDDPEGRVDSFGKVFKVSRLTTTTKQYESVSAKSRYRKSTCKSSSPKLKP
jgi:hypothetical protein